MNLTWRRARRAANDPRQEELSVSKQGEGDGDGGDGWSCQMCKAPVKSLSATNQHPAFYRTDALAVAQPTVTKHQLYLAFIHIYTAR